MYACMYACIVVKRSVALCCVVLWSVMYVCMHALRMYVCIHTLNIHVSCKSRNITYSL